MRGSLVVLLAVATAACGSGGTSSTAPSVATPTVAITTDTFSGTVSVGGSDAHTFTVKLTNGNLDVTLTAAGPPPTIFMGIAIGAPSGSGCTPYANAFTVAQAGTAAQMSFSGVPAADYCVIVYDVGNQAADVTYTVTASHY